MNAYSPLPDLTDRPRQHPPHHSMQTPARRYLALSLPLLATDRIARQRWGNRWRLAARPDTPPLVIAGRRNNTIRLVALDEMAMQNGLFRGQSLTDARAILPTLDVVGEDGAADRELVLALASWCDRYTPLVSCGPDDTASHNGAVCDGNLILDITGCSRLFGGEANLIRDLLTCLFHQGIAANAAIAPTPGGAWALARFTATPPLRSVDAAPQPAGAACIAADSAELASLLPPLPLAALRLDGETLSALARVGLRRVGQIMERPRAPLARRFGRMLLLRLDQALGAVEEAVSPRLPAPDFSAERRLAEPVVSTTDIGQLTLRLATLLCEQMERHGKGARLLDLALWRVDSKVFRLAVGASRPLRQPELMLRLFQERIAGLHDDLDAGFGFDMLRLSASVTEDLVPDEPRFMTSDHDPAGRHANATSDLADRLAARLGENAILHAVRHDTHLPEESWQLVPSAQLAQAHPNRPEPAMRLSGLPPLRPLRLFEHPEPVEAIARIPDGPPLRFRWRRVLHEVARAEGPERIEDEWWRAVAIRQVRDYFRVEDHGGRRFWLFREGHYGSPEMAPRWFMHGLFA